MNRSETVAIAGAGPTGTLLSILLRRRGFDVALFEGRPDPGLGPGESGRSINLALADRGIHALKLAGVYDRVADALVPMRGRFIHPQDGAGSLQLYGQRPSEVIYSISRHRLNQVLLDIATRQHGVRVHFEHRLEGVDFARGAAQFHDLRTNSTRSVPARPLLAADGAGSTTRHCMTALGLIQATETDLEHGYKELSIPAAGGRHQLARDALHIWPRGNYMLIALPNAGGSFTATLFLRKRGAVSFENLTSTGSIARFLSDNFPDAYALMPDGVLEFQQNPTGFLGTVQADRWHVRGQALLVGDSAHAIVPFHGQGMNCCFEDCVEFDAALDRHSQWENLFEDFFSARKANTDAIAEMALENYREMRELVVDPNFRLQQTLALELERRHPTRFIPRYSMVMFHHEISYRVAQQRGALQKQLLEELTGGAATLADVDFAKADAAVERILAPIAVAT